MLTDNRIIFLDGGTLIDFSRQLSNIHSETKVLDYTTAVDKVFIGADLPFNHRYLELDGSNVNSVDAEVTVKIWDGNEFVEAVDIQDDTRVGNASMGRSGVISWDVDRNSSFGKENSTEDIPDLSALKIYKLYWIELTWDATLTVSTALNYVGYKFTKDEDLDTYYTDLNRASTKTAILAGKTDYNEQHVAAAEQIILDLRKKNIIFSRNQILDFDTFINPAQHKVAEIIYTPFGESHEVQMDKAEKRYNRAMNGLNFGVDRNNDGVLDRNETVRSSVLRRA